MATNDHAGRIILINGTSSSGKTTLVKGLQATLPDLWLEMGIDRFAYALPGRIQGVPTWPQLFRYVRLGDSPEGPFTIETTALGSRFIAGMHTTVAALARLGLNVIVDQVVLERAWLEECARLWADFEVLFVGVRCPLEVILERERKRTDRTVGQAGAQFDVVHRWATYERRGRHGNAEPGRGHRPDPGGPGCRPGPSEGRPRPLSGPRVRRAAAFAA